MIDTFFGMLSGVAAAPANRFILVDTRNALARSTGAQNG